MRNIYVSTRGQEDNIGDSILRRGYLDALRSVGRLHILVSHFDSYNSGLGLRDEDVLYQFRPQWRRAVLAGCLRGEMTFALNAGEAMVDADYARYCARLTTLSALAKTRQAKFVIAGSGFRPGFSTAPRAVRALARMSDFVAWRDVQSREAAGSGSVAPDWAFGTGQRTSVLTAPGRSDHRDLLSFSLRAAGPRIADQRIGQIKDLARQLDVEPVLVPQVARDNEAAETVAREHGLRCFPWLDGGHLEREILVRSLYARSAVVVSNRVHALVLGITEGAVPLVPAEWSADKAERIFSAAGISGITVGATERLDEALARIEATCFEQLAGARDRLERSALELAAAVRSDPTPPAPSLRRVIEPRPAAAQAAAPAAESRAAPMGRAVPEWSG